jgi:replicative DNA helicase
MIYSYELETQLLAGLLKYPQEYCKIASFISDKDFFSESNKINKTIFLILKQSLENTESINEVILSQRVKDLGISFEENINVSDYIESLSVKKIGIDAVESTAKELKKITIRRQIFERCRVIAQKMRTIPATASYQEIIESADKEFNDQINLYELGDDKPENIFDTMEDDVETLGNNPITDFGLSGPYKKVQDIYGSLVRPGNITVVVARSGVGKSSLAMDFTTKVSYEHNVPVLHFDNGEMTIQELKHRQCAAMAQVPLHLIETGTWRKAGKEIVEKVRSVWAKIKNMKFYYYNVGGTNVDAQINLLKRFYFSNVGRGKQMIFSFDYIKTTNEMAANNKQEWQVVGEMVDKYKKCIQRELVFDNVPYVSMFTSVQANRTGIVTNRNSSTIVDDESIVSLSDRITQFSSHTFILREKTVDELESEKDFGTHKLINVKKRHLGKDIAGALNPVKMPDGTFRRNFINLDFSNFGITEKGDLRDIVKSMEDHIAEDTSPNDLPKGLN